MLSDFSRKKPRLPAAARLREAKLHLRRGGVLAYATESCFGLGCDPNNARALRQILRLKGRPNHKGMIVLAQNLSAARVFCAPLSAEDAAFCAQAWPGFRSLLLPKSPRVLALLSGKHDTLALRVPNFAPLNGLLAVTGALVSTSANRAGKKSLKQARDVAKTFPEVLLLRGQVGGARRASCIMDVKTGRVLR